MLERWTNSQKKQKNGELENPAPTTANYQVHKDNH